MGDAARRWVDSDGVRLAVYERGEPTAPTIVLVHGYPDNATVWDLVARRLAERFHVVSYDVRGHGRSAAPDRPDGYRLAALRGDLLAVVRAVSAEPVHLVGHDWGGIQSWAALDDDQIASFTTISGPDLGHASAWLRGWRRRPLRVLRQLSRSWYIGAFRVPGVPEAVWRLPALRRRFGADYRDARNGLSLYRMNVGRAPTPSAVTVPVQQIAPVHDAYVTRALLDAAEPWCARLHRRELVAGHWAPRTHPDAVARMIAEFVDHVGGAPAVRELARADVHRPGRELGGRLALVTGAGSGIGRATALALAAEGAEVLCVDLDFAAAERTARDTGGLAYRLDVADGTATAQLAEHVVAEHGVPDLLMANAGIAVAGPFLDTAEEDWAHLLDVNLWGVVHTLRAFLPHLVDRAEGGHVVVTSSAAGYVPLPSLPAYGTSKAAVLMLAQSLAGELRPAGIGVSAICPGFVHTNITATARFAGTDPAEQRRRQAAATAAYQRRGYGPDRVAAAVLAAVRENRLVAPVTPEARAGALGMRFAPRVTRALARRLDSSQR